MASQKIKQQQRAKKPAAVILFLLAMFVQRNFSKNIGMMLTCVNIQDWKVCCLKLIQTVNNCLLITQIILYVGFQCQHCDKAFQKYSTLKSHIDVSHYDESKGKPEFICDVDGCGKSYSIRVGSLLYSVLIKIYLFSSISLTFIIYFCQESLRIHIRKVHEGRVSKQTRKICEQCGKSFSNVRNDFKKMIKPNTDGLFSDIFLD